MAPKSPQPKNADIMSCLKGIDTWLSLMETRLGSLEKVKTKVDNLDQDMEKLWKCLDNRGKRTNERLQVVDDNMESVDFSVDRFTSKVSDIQF